MNSKKVEEITNKLKKDGWKVEVNMLGAIKKDDSVWWYDFGGLEILSAIKRTKKVSIGVYGDIFVHKNYETENGEENYFKCKEGGKPEGELSDDLVENGEWENNNWFEIFVEDSKTKNFITIDTPTSLEDAVNIFFDTIEKIDNGEMN